MKMLVAAKQQQKKKRGEGQQRGRHADDNGAQRWRPRRDALAALLLIAALLLSSLIATETLGKKAGKKKSNNKSSSSAKKLNSNCNNCKRIADDFFKGLDKTANSIDFTGSSKGWSKDNEKFMGKYAMNEARFHAAMESVCDNKEYSCISLLEDVEEVIEEWFVENYSEDVTKEDFVAWLCVEENKFCCKEGHYGKACKACPVAMEKVCGGNGKCQGDGLRTGSGKCKCDGNFSGKTCTECAAGYFLSQDAQSGEAAAVECQQCNVACALSCTGPDATHCDQCRQGFEDIEGTCVDIDECDVDEPPCADIERTFCSNTPGSFACEQCDSACATGCTGPNPADCEDCKPGFESLVGGGCKDIDECSENSSICTDAGEFCENQYGAFACRKCPSACTACVGSEKTKCTVCKPGYALEMIGNADSNAKGSGSDQHEQEPSQEKTSVGECVDINECLQFPCSDAETCQNFAGSHTCKCNAPATKTAEGCLLPDAVSSAVSVDSVPFETPPSDSSDNTYLHTKTFTVGQSDGPFKIVSVTFPEEHADAIQNSSTLPIIRGIVTTNECCGDKFEFSVADVSQEGFSCVVRRSDTQEGWGQELKAKYYVTIEPQRGTGQEEHVPHGEL